MAKQKRRHQDSHWSEQLVRKYESNYSDIREMEIALEKIKGSFGTSKLEDLAKGKTINLKSKIEEHKNLYAKLDRKLKGVERDMEKIRAEVQLEIINHLKEFGIEADFNQLMESGMKIGGEELSIFSRRIYDTSDLYYDELDYLDDDW